MPTATISPMNHLAMYLHDEISLVGMDALYGFLCCLYYPGRRSGSFIIRRIQSESIFSMRAKQTTVNQISGLGMSAASLFALHPLM